MPKVANITAVALDVPELSATVEAGATADVASDELAERMCQQDKTWRLVVDEPGDTAPTKTRAADSGSDGSA